MFKNSIELTLNEIGLDLSSQETKKSPYLLFSLTLEQCLCCGTAVFGVLWKGTALVPILHICANLKAGPAHLRCASYRTLTYSLLNLWPNLVTQQ